MVNPSWHNTREGERKLEVKEPSLYVIAGFDLLGGGGDVSLSLTLQLPSQTLQPPPHNILITTLISIQSRPPFAVRTELPPLM